MLSNVCLLNTYIYLCEYCVSTESLYIKNPPVSVVHIIALPLSCEKLSTKVNKNMDENKGDIG